MSIPQDENEFQAYLEIPFAHAQVTAGTAAKLWQCPAGRTFRVDAIPYVNPTGLAEDASNHFTVAIANVSRALTFTGKTFTAANATEIFTSAAHGLLTGDGPVQVSNSGGALPTGLSAATDYYIIKIDADTFYLATSRAAAYAGTNLLITSDGTGTHTLSAVAATVRPVIVGSYSTNSAGAGTNTLVANAFTPLALSSTDADVVVGASEELALILIEGGTATLPAGSGTIRGRFVA